jgi:hypothetical protein
MVIPPTGKLERSGEFSAEDDQKDEWVRWNQQRDKEIKP